jgi:hypothetical protein
MIRQRNSAQIRQDAINMAIKKANQGCLGCAQNYFELARKHGATEEEIYQSIDNPSIPITKVGISRRTLLKIAMGVAAGLTLGSATLLSGKAEADSGFWGTDTDSSSCCGLPQNFYVGRLGYGISTNNTQYFNRDAANAAGYNSTYAYWDIEGPDAAPMGRYPYPYLWGYQQGLTAGSERSYNPNASYIGGNTIFGDIEGGNPGWGNDQAANQAVLQGFLDGIQHNFNMMPGVYISPISWQSFFGSSFAANQGFVLWITGAQTCTISCAPCDSCADTRAQVQNLAGSVSQNLLGTSGPVIWQYWIGNCRCGDYDFAWQDPSAGFSPVMQL